MAIRGGGHNGAGWALRRWPGHRPVPHEGHSCRSRRAKTVRVEAGCVWGEVDHATHAFGMATPSGFIFTTGVAGLTLGGGIGYLTRQYGLTIDNLLPCDVVLADGSFVTASAKENSDLFWAMRGGGGNFGVVTSFLFRLHPVKRCSSARRFGRWKKPRTVLSAYTRFHLRAPEDDQRLLRLPGRAARADVPRSICISRRCAPWSGVAPVPPKRRKELKPMRSLGHPLFDHFRSRALSRGAKHVRWPVYARFAVVLEGRQLHRGERRSYRPPHRAWLGNSHHALDHASLSRQWRRHTRGQERHRLQLSRGAICTK